MYEDELLQKIWFYLGDFVLEILQPNGCETFAFKDAFFTVIYANVLLQTDQVRQKIFCPAWSTYNVTFVYKTCNSGVCHIAKNHRL